MFFKKGLQAKYPAKIHILSKRFFPGKVKLIFLINETVAVPIRCIRMHCWVHNCYGKMLQELPLAQPLIVGKSQPLITISAMRNICQRCGYDFFSGDSMLRQMGFSLDWDHSTQEKELMLSSRTIFPAPKSPKDAISHIWEILNTLGAPEGQIVPPRLFYIGKQCRKES